MNRQRVLATRPGPVNGEKLWNEARAAWATLLDISDVDGVHLGFDFDGATPTSQQVQALVDAHDPTPAPPTAEQTAFVQAVGQLRSTFNTNRSAAQMNNSIDAITVILRRIVAELRP